MPTIKIKGSSTAAAEPLTLAERELAVNVTDKKLYVGDGAAVRKIVGSLGNQEASAVAITGGSIAGITDLAVADGGTGASTAADARTNLGITATGADTTYAFRSNNLSDLASASTARTNLGLGSIATQASSSVSITGGSITGVTDIAIADGGTGASTAADARTNLGLGSIATQSASSVSITGGTISGITDLAVADGGTGASTAADARTNLSVPSTTGSGASGTWGIDISGNAATATSATSATTATNLAGGAANRVPYQSASGTTTFVAAPTVTNSYLKWNGTALGWDTVSGGGGGSGDVVGPASATDNQIVLFDSTTGKLIKAATTTGLLKASTGVIAAAVSGTDYAPATSGSANQLLASNGTGGFTNLTTGTGVVTALGVNTGSSGAFVVNGGALGTPQSGTVTNLTGTASININGTVGATTANTGAFTTLSASSTVSGTGFSTYLASPPAIGGTTAAAGTFTTLTANGNTTLGDATTDTITLTGTVQPGVVISGSSSGDALRITQTGAGNALFVEDSTNPDSTPFVVDTSGNVGIGTSSPGYKLNVSGAGYVFGLNGGGTTRVAQTFGNTGGSLDLGIEGSAGGTVFTGGSAYAGVIGTSNATVLQLGTNGTIRATLDSSGNLGLGVTPSAWGSSFYKAIEGGDANSQGAIAFNLGSTSNGVDLWSNGYFDGTNSIYKYSATAGLYQVAGNVHRWYNAPSGTAGNAITFTQAMTLDASGNLGIGTSSPSSILDVQKAGTAAATTDLLELTNSGNAASMTNTGTGILFNQFYYDATTPAVADAGRIAVKTEGNWTSTASTQDAYMTFEVAVDGTVTERARITSGGDFLIGGFTAESKLNVYSGGGTFSSGTMPAGMTIYGNTNDGQGSMLSFKATSGAQGIAGIAGVRSSGYETELRFYTNNTNSQNAFTERARITSGGDLLVGTDNSSGTAGAGFKTLSGRPVVVNAASANTTTVYEAYSTGASAYRFYVGMGGTIYATSTTITAISDQRLKENIQDIDVGLNAVMALKPRKFDWKEGKGKDKKGDRGWIAQEFEQVFPDMITTWKDEPPEGEEPYKAVNADLIPVLVKAIQEQQALITSLTARVAALEGTQP